MSMKIPGIGDSASLRAYAAQDLGKKSALKDEGAAIGKDTADISSKAKEMYLYRTELDKLPSIRQDLVDGIKQRIINGTYKADATAIANEMFNESRLDKLV